MGKTVIDVRDARKTYVMGQERIRAVDGVSFTIEEGEFCCILGTSGSGKSTLLNLLAGIEKLTAGDIIINGSSIRKMSEKKLSRFRQDNLGFVFQSYNLLGSMTALENVELPLVFKRISPGKRRKMAKSILKKVGLGSRMDHKPKEMSGGQQQRVGIARAFVARPKIVFADEPTGNLDSKTTIEVMQLIKGMALKNKQTIVMVTHDISLAGYADKIIHVSDGKITEIEYNENPKGVPIPETKTGDNGDKDASKSEAEVNEPQNVEQDAVKKDAAESEGTDTPENICENISEDLPENTSENTPENTPENTSENISENTEADQQKENSKNEEDK